MTQKRRRSPNSSNAAPSLQFLALKPIPSIFKTLIPSLRNMVVMHSSQITLDLLKREFLLLEIIPVIILRSDKRDQDGVYDWGQA